MAENPYVNKVEYGNQTLIDLTGDTVTPQTLLEGVTAHDKSGAPISGAVAVAPPSTTTPKMDGVAAVGTETAFARGDHVHPRDTSKQDTLVSGTNIKTVNNQSLLGAGDLKVAMEGLSVLADNTNPYLVQSTPQTIISITENGTDEEIIGMLMEDYPGTTRSHIVVSCLGDSGEFGNNFGQIPVSVEANIPGVAGVKLYGIVGTNLVTYHIQTPSGEYSNPVWSKTVTPLFTVSQTQGNWRYKVYADGTFEAWYTATKVNITITAQSGNLYRSDLVTITLPSDMTSGKTCNILHVSVNAAHNNYPAWGMLASIQTPTANTFKYYAMSGGSRTASPNYTVTAYVFGTLE